MCTKPLPMINHETGEEIAVACRKCNACLLERKNGWVARAMAEAATSKYVMAFTMTYSNDTEESRAGSKSFIYRHIKLFMKNLRRQAQHHYGVTGAIRFLVCGEIGSDHERVHWHLILFTDVDLMALGKWVYHSSDTPNKFKKGADITDESREEKFAHRVNWSLWKHGFSFVEQSDQGGIEYCLKYCVKDQFNIVNSEGTMRYSNAENWASSYFRMSKLPPIGFIYLQRKLAELKALGAVLPSLKISIDGYSGYWFPKGNLREFLIDGLREINQEILDRTGKPAPQYSTLVSSLVSLKNEKDLERLLYGTQNKEEQISDEEFEKALDLSQREALDKREYVNTRRRCGGLFPCNACQESFSDRQVREFKEWARREALGYHSEREDKERRRQYKLNPFCNLKETDQVKRTFQRFA